MIAAAGVGALQMLSGAPEIILCTWLAIGALFVAQTFKREAPRAALFWRTILVVGLIMKLSSKFEVCSVV